MSDRGRTRSKRNVADVQRTSRSALGSLWLTQGHVPPPSSPIGFLTKRVWPWITHYASVAFSRRRPMPPTPGGPSPCVYRMPDDAVIGLAGDWGTGTESAYRVGDLIEQTQPRPHVTIHLGDVYYSGTQKEYANVFLGEDDWPRGTERTFALNGNHEMYSGGSGYFDEALPALGQPTSFFALQNAHWRIVGVDTGYYAGIFPLLEKLLRGRIRLPDENVRWLRQVVFADPADRRPVILLSHHQLFSAFEDGYQRMGRDLVPYLDRVLLWFWGHEHRFAGYNRAAVGGVPAVRARCIGHGGMPVEIKEQPKTVRNGLVFYDQRHAGILDKEPIGFCGYAVLRFDGPRLAIEYVDEQKLPLLTERWEQQNDGRVIGTAQRHDLDRPALQQLTVPGSIDDLVRT